MKHILTLLISTILIFPAMAGFEVKENQGRLEIHDGDQLIFGWQAKPLQEPKGGEIFSASAFIHPLHTPSGFELTKIQPDDHLHHLGVWWPWKMVTVDGKDYVTWEMQNKEGQHVAVGAKVIKESADEVVIEANNQTLIRPTGGEGKPILDEQVELRFFRVAKDAYGLDIHIVQQPVEGIDVTVTKYRYSGFSWRGTGDWNKENSEMRTSGGNNRDNANSQQANWVTVDGATPGGRATMLMMSVAAKGGEAEQLRVWDSKMHGGAPFVNFNPVMKTSEELKPENKRVSDRRYRLIVADRVISPDEADKLWQEWKVE